ncbi:hypothetical protein OHB26_28060 [Nocardia sp. NBC_01503]|uniref:hypothetical protein n=1 Tax=Nocardia sp. NBC_01503 TaxID=2975997 RepID=UPI002E7C12D8|nr:hypothetical protein [Nocardia sp. NBC_01503]WTL30761.1 hypothetical protein OHB26_28060 [Nocardia sp. NBC_01503]
MADDLWESYADVLTWRLFTLPLGGRIMLSPGQGRTARFTRDGGGLEWALFAPGQDNLPSRRLPWPARFSEYESFATMAVRGFRELFGVTLPFELTAQAWVEDAGERLETRGIGFAEFGDDMSDLDADAAFEMIEIGREIGASDREVRTHDHGLAMVYGTRMLEQQQVEILIGGAEQWPVRDHTVHFIGVSGDDRLVVMDVFVNLEGLEGIPAASTEVDGRMVDRGTPAYARAMIDADPDFRRVLAQRPALAQGLAEHRVQIDYSILEIDSRQRALQHRFDGAPPVVVDLEYSDGAVDDANGPATDPIDVRLPFDPFPLLQPADWPYRNRIPHWPSASGNAPIIVLTGDTGAGYAIQSYDQSAPESEFMLPAAIARLTGLHRYDWEIDELYGLAVATCSGHDFSAEKVLDPHAMLDAHNALRTARLWVATPRRTCLTAVPYDLDDRQALVFQHLVRLTYDDDSYGNAPITRGVYLVEHGRITTFVDDVDLIGRH